MIKQSILRQRTCDLSLKIKLAKIILVSTFKKNEYLLHLTITENFKDVDFAFNGVISTRGYQRPRKMKRHDDGFLHLEVGIDDIIPGQTIYVDLRQIRIQAENVRET